MASLTTRIPLVHFSAKTVWNFVGVRITLKLYGARWCWVTDVLAVLYSSRLAIHFTCSTPIQDEMPLTLHVPHLYRMKGHWLLVTVKSPSQSWSPPWQNSWCGAETNSRGKPWASQPGDEYAYCIPNPECYLNMPRWIYWVPKINTISAEQLHRAMLPLLLPYKNPCHC